MTGLQALKLSIVGVALCIVSCKESAGPHSYPPDLSTRLKRVLDAVKHQQDRCYSAKNRYCSFDELLSMPSEDALRAIRVQSASRASFNRYNLTLYMTDHQYCIATFPIQIEPESEVVWRDSLGKEYRVKLALGGVPDPCKSVTLEDPATRSKAQLD